MVNFFQQDMSYIQRDIVFQINNFYRKKNKFFFAPCFLKIYFSELGGDKFIVPYNKSVKNYQRERSRLSSVWFFTEQ